VRWFPCVRSTAAVRAKRRELPCSGQREVWGRTKKEKNRKKTVEFTNRCAVGWWLYTCNVFRRAVRLPSASSTEGMCGRVVEAEAGRRRPIRSDPLPKCCVVLCGVVLVRGMWCCALCAVCCVLCGVCVVVRGAWCEVPLALHCHARCSRRRRCSLEHRFHRLD